MNFMSKELLLHLGVSALLAATVSLLLQPSSEGAKESAAGVVEPARVAALENEVRRLEARLKRLQRQSRGRAAGRSGAGSGSESLEEIVAAAEQAARAELGESPVSAEAIESDGAVRESLGRVVREEMQTAREERFERRANRRAERRAEMVREFAAEQGLSDEAEETLTAAMDQENEQVMELFREAREDGSWRSARAASEALRAETDEQLAQVLNEEQLEAWQALRQEGSSRRGP